jgi:hypothetical protein
VKLAPPLLSPLLCVCLIGCQASNRESKLRSAFRTKTGHIAVPDGTTELHAPLEFEAGAHDIDVRGASSASILKLADDFKGKAAIIGAGVKNIRLEGFQIVGSRRELRSVLYLPGSSTRFIDYYDRNGIAFLDSEGIAISGVSLKSISDFAILITHSTAVNITAVTIEDSGTLDSRGLSNSAGGILLEQGAANFTVTRCRIKNVTGNGIWTHSNADAPRDQDGRITGNEIWGTPRDAIQIGHAARIQVLDNSGGQIGYPVEQVDLPAQATPVALDSAGNVSESIYSGNHFEDVNGQCIDLDGFHDGQVLNNSCVNRKPPAGYPLSHVGVVFGNSNPEMTSRNVILSGNLIQGFGYGAVYLIGEGHQVSGNRFVDVNRNHCTGDMRVPRCGYAPDEPGMLRSGIYLASHAARPAETTRNKISGNYISGFGMDQWCIAAGPGVVIGSSEIHNNTCVAATQEDGVR